MQKGLWIYLIVMNLIGLAVMAMDKSKARHHAWRIPEKTLFLVSILGGSVGTWAGMYLFHHKTKHWYFVVGMPAILILQICIAVLIWKTHGFGMCSRHGLRQRIHFLNKFIIEYLQKVLYNEL